ncbi:hypothetical protein [Limnofasciculus baicalensis]|uniref:Uncharacterized protein n=1 Tax=Limnofasciculus baicalensis BBK-W-15 TaxID=2699891 RepID=A0AAE3KNB8_9CYAN|nr:hypothetical protein [Limnofasciculus baicalensis]MCP2730184.1 hypothetical protein [Limnofasciculus baicalensis BBK-W-15]
MTQRDRYLRQLIETVCQEPKNSLRWRKAMNQLLLEIQQLPGLTKSNHPDYDEVLDDTLLKLAEEIQEFEPKHSSIETSLVGWINIKLRLKYEVRELHSQSITSSKNRSHPQGAKEEFNAQARKQPLSLDVPIGEEGSETFGSQLPAKSPCNLWEVQSAIAKDQKEQENERIGIKLKQYIEQDPERRLQSCHPRPYPNCNCQILSQRLLLKYPPDKMVDIARDLEVNYNTLNWHWKNRGIPLLQEIAKNLGYQPDNDY